MMGSQNGFGGQVVKALYFLGRIMTRKRRILWRAALLILLSPVMIWALYAFVKQEHFYRGRPSSYWSQEIQKWNRQKWSRDLPPWSAPWLDKVIDAITGHATPNQPAVLSGDESALPVLGDLLHDRQVRGTVIVAL